MLKLRFPSKELLFYCDKYSYIQDESTLRKEARIFLKRGFLVKEEFLDICYWKTPRSQSRCCKNEEEYVNEVTKIALLTENEKLRIEILTLLSGVSWPTASTILHFCFPELYPILDYRALWSLGLEKPPTQYNFEFWWNYVVTCREISSQNNLTMRKLDKALWQYSKEHQL